MKIYKFGKIPTGSVQEMKGMLRLIDNSIPQIIVLSATTETTERLVGIAAHLFNRDTEQAHDEISRLEFRFIDFANELFNDESIKQQAVDSIIDRFRTLWNFTCQRFTSVDEKDILAQGEFISSMLVSLYLKEQGINVTVADINILYGKDPSKILDVMAKTSQIVTVEDHNINGGLGSYISRLATENQPVKVKRIALTDFAESGPAKELADAYG